MKKIFEDFKNFAFKGNIIDMAIGIIIGTAFTAIINSLVSDILMPLITSATAGVRYEDLAWVLKEAVLDTAGEIVTPAVAIKYGLFLQNVVYFIIVAVSCFLAIRIITNSSNKFKAEADKLKKKIIPGKPTEPEPEPEPEAPPAPTQEELLTEIRDLLKGNTESNKEN